MDETFHKENKAIGILLHPSSLPGTPFCGSFGAEARNWIKHLATNGIGVWQFLPLAPTDSLGSPYSSPSSFAYNPWFIDLDDLISEGYLSLETAECLQKFENNKNSGLNFELAEFRSQKIAELLIKEWDNQSIQNQIEFEDWCRKQFWLDEHAIFLELRRQYNNKPWWEWPTEFALRKKESLAKCKKIFYKNILSHKLMQWHLDRQWKSLRKLANEMGVLLFGDLPFYVSRDSADVWSHRSLFSVFENGELYLQSGVPPDYFSSTGQLWGNPVYRWNRHKSSNFKWWRNRFARHLEQVDLLRLDHFRALNSFWAVSGNAETAERGFWLPSPGCELLNWLKKDSGGKLPLIAEDLGVITSGVEDLRDNFALPGMKILQFAFDGNLDNPYLPENIKGTNWVVYSGTHDNQTTLSWWDELDEGKKKNILEKYKYKDDYPNWIIIEIGLATDTKLFIAPIQDLLSLDDHNRFNTPGTKSGNWSWRINEFDSNFISSISKYGKLACNFNRNTLYKII